MIAAATIWVIGWFFTTSLSTGPGGSSLTDDLVMLFVWPSELGFIVREHIRK